MASDEALREQLDLIQEQLRHIEAMLSLLLRAQGIDPEQVKAEREAVH